MRQTKSIELIIGHNNQVIITDVDIRDNYFNNQY